jgi:hypothetical protein
VIQGHFNDNVLTEECIQLVPSLFEAAEGVNSCMVKVSSATVIQDCLEDEFYQPAIEHHESKTKINSGLWTRSIHDPRGVIDLGTYEPAGYSDLQVRKRLLATCTETGKPFVVALYRRGASEEEWEKWRQETFKMNSLHNLIGIYEEASSSVHGDGEFEDPNCNYPTLHLIKSCEHRVLGLVPIHDDVSGIRARLLDYLCKCFGEGDSASSASEALLLCLVSRPSMRVDGLVDSLFIGKLSLNLCIKGSSASTAVCELVSLLRALKPFVSGPVKVESTPEGAFTKTSIYPRLDVQSGQLLPGAALQQPDGCVLVIDETGLCEGEFKDQAVCNLQALIDLIRLQHVTYDFGMQQVSLKTDMPVISVSQSKKSVLPFDLQVNCDGFAFHAASNEDLCVFRSFLEHCRLLTCAVDEDMASFLEQDYLALRKSSPLLPNGNPKMNEQEFHRLMNLARLSAISEAQTTLTKSIWERTKALHL